MPIPHEEMRRIIKRRIQGKEGTERIQVLKSLLAEFPGYYTGPYGDLRKWVRHLIDEATLRRSVKHRDEFHVPKDGCAQVVLVGPTNAGKSTLLRALTGRPVAVGDYRFTTLRPAAGVLSIGGARVQLVDLPGLLEGARGGVGGGRIVLACIRAADALLYCLPAERDGFQEGLAAAFAAEAAAVFPGLPVVATSQDDDRQPVVDLIWSLLNRIRVWPAPKGKRAAEPVVLPTESTVADFVAALDGRWQDRFRHARVTGPSARFHSQAVGLGHHLADGDELDVALAP